MAGGQAACGKVDAFLLRGSNGDTFKLGRAAAGRHGIAGDFLDGARHQGCHSAEQNCAVGLGGGVVAFGFCCGTGYFINCNGLSR